MVDSLDLKFYIALNHADANKKYYLLTGTMTVLNVPTKVGEQAHALAYVSPTTLRRLMGDNKAFTASADIKAYAVEISYGGQLIGGHHLGPGQMVGGSQQVRGGGRRDCSQVEEPFRATLAGLRSRREGEIIGHPATPAKNSRNPGKVSHHGRQHLRSPQSRFAARERRDLRQDALRRTAAQAGRFCRDARRSRRRKPPGFPSCAWRSWSWRRSSSSRGARSGMPSPGMWCSRASSSCRHSRTTRRTRSSSLRRGRTCPSRSTRSLGLRIHR